LGEYVHNLVDLPQLTLLSPENSIPALISVLLFLAWWQLPYKRVTALALLGWTFMHLIGGAVLTIIPFEFLPFYPAQTPTHYLMHIIYGVAQLPLIVALIRQLKLSQQSKSLSGAKV
jgi:hypothetical protein